jgi:hypothetical protein
LVDRASPGAFKDQSAGHSSKAATPGTDLTAVTLPKGEIGHQTFSGLDSPADPESFAMPEALETAHAGQPAQGEGSRRAHDPGFRLNHLAQSAASQIAEAVRLPLDGSIEIRLSPEELGRVRLSMIPGEAGLVVQMIAERPETLELLRRHVDLLAADLQDAGYSGLEFSFSREDRRRDPSGADIDAPPSDANSKSPALSAVPPRTNRSPSGGALDLRL